MCHVPKALFVSLVAFSLFFLPLLAGQLDFEHELKCKTIPGLNLTTNHAIDDLLVNDDTGTAEQGSPAIAGDGLGNFVVTWHDFRSGYPDTYAQRYNSSGTPSGPNFRVNDDVGIKSPGSPTVAVDHAGNFVIAWEDRRSGYYDIYELMRIAIFDYGHCQQSGGPSLKR